MEPFIKDVEKTQNAKSAAWLKDLKKNNVECGALVDWEKTDLSTSIVKAAKKNGADLIALSTHRGPIAQALLSSVARDVLLQAKCPILVSYRPKRNKSLARTHVSYSESRA